MNDKITRYDFPKSSPDHHWLECGNCGYRMMAVKSLKGIFCAICKNGSLRAVEEEEPVDAEAT